MQLHYARSPLHLQLLPTLFLYSEERAFHFVPIVTNATFKSGRHKPNPTPYFNIYIHGFSIIKNHCHLFGNKSRKSGQLDVQYTDNLGHNVLMFVILINTINI